MMESIKIKRIYDGLSDDDGFRILIDRLWPRGVKKETAGIDVWMKEVTPSPALRTWFSHDPGKWASFSRQYLAELKAAQPSVDKLVDYVHRYKTVTLLYGAKDVQHTHALILERYVKSLLKKHTHTNATPKKK